METFGEKKAALEQLGWHVELQDEYRGEPGVDRQEYDMDLFSWVELPLTTRDWCRLCIKDDAAPLCLKADEKSEDGRDLYWSSEYIGWNEGELRDAQHTVRMWFYEGGGISVGALVTLGELLRDHGADQWGEENNPFKDPTPEQLAEYVKHGVEGNLSAWGKIAVCYHLTKDHYNPEVPEAQHERTDKLEGAFMLVHSMAWGFGMGNFFSNHSMETRTTDSVNRTIRLYRFLPAFKIVYEQAERLAPDPIEGWALIDLEKGEGEVAENGFGYCIYATKAEAERMMGLWRNAQEQHEDEACTPRKLRTPIDEKIKLRAVRVSLKKGIEFLDEGAAPKPRVKWKAKPHWYKEETEDRRMLFDQYCETRTILSSYRREDETDDRTYEMAHDEAWYAWEAAAEFFEASE